METKKFILISNSTDGMDYESYCEYCRELGYEPEPNNSHAYYEWCESETQINLECDWANMQASQIANEPCVLTGDLGLWHGTPSIVPLYFDSVMSALRKAVSSGELYEVSLDKNTIEVRASHHDGTNYFIVNLLSAKGKRKYANYYDGETIEDSLRKEYFKQVKERMVF